MLAVKLQDVRFGNNCPSLTDRNPTRNSKIMPSNLQSERNTHTTNVLTSGKATEDAVSRPGGCGYRTDGERAEVTVGVPVSRTSRKHR